MRIGHHLLVFNSRTKVKDNFGQAKEVWAEAFRVRGAYQAAGSREFPTQQKRNAESTARFIIWYRSDLDTSTASANYQIVFNNRTWNIFPPIQLDGRPKYSRQEGGIGGGFVYLEIESSEIAP
jgi:head-tail adaptor